MFAALLASSDEMFRNFQTIEEDDLSIDQQLKNIIAFTKELCGDLDFYCLNFYMFFNIPAEFQDGLGNEEKDQE